MNEVDNPTFTHEAQQHPNVYDHIHGRDSSIHVYQTIKGNENDIHTTEKTVYTNADNKYVEIIPDNQPSMYVILNPEQVERTTHNHEIMPEMSRSDVDTANDAEYFVLEKQICATFSAERLKLREIIMTFHVFKNFIFYMIFIRD